MLDKFGLESRFSFATQYGEFRKRIMLSISYCTNIPGDLVWDKIDSYHEYHSFRGSFVNLLERSDCNTKQATLKS